MQQTILMANIMLAIIFVGSAASIFFVYEAKHRNEPIIGYVAKAMIYVMPVLTIVCTDVFNTAYFHFSGFPGLVVAAVLTVGIFCLAPLYGMRYACRSYLHKDLVAQAA